jgi:hypothetical protein
MAPSPQITRTATMKELMLLTFGMACGAFMAKKHCDQKVLEREIAREKARQPHNH